VLRYVGLAAKLILSLGLLAWVVSRIDTSQAIKFFLHPATTYGVVVAVGALVLQGILAAGRQVLILRLLGQSLTFPQSLNVWFSGLLVTQVAVTFIAGDLIRGMLLVSDGVPRRAAGRAIVLDRIVGLGMLLVMVDAVSPYILTFVSASSFRYSLLLLMAAASSGILALFMAGFARHFVEMLPWQILQYRPVELAVDLASVTRFLFTGRGRSLAIIALSFAMHICNIAGIVAIALSLGVQAPVWAMGAVALPVMLFALLPISLAGWGVREAALVMGFGMLHVPAPLALATSIGFGLSVILAGLLGVIGLIQKRIDWHALVRSPELPRS